MHNKQSFVTYVPSKSFDSHKIIRQVYTKGINYNKLCLNVIGVPSLHKHQPDNTELFPFNDTDHNQHSLSAMEK
jgi:hypothetical protein